MLNNFSIELESLIGKPTDLRPFVCDGSPLDCQIVIVGFNPASEMSQDFWSFWSDDYGFKKQAWLETYKTERLSRPLKPGKTKRYEFSNSRRVIEWIIEAAYPVRCLETNIYSKPTHKALDLDALDRISAPFDYLLKCVEPKLVIAHGKDAAEYFQKQKLRTDLRCVPHFSRGWSQIKARELGFSIRQFFENK